MSGITIEIEYPWEAHTLLSNDFIDESHSAQAFRLDLIEKIRRGIRQKEYCNVWRQIEAFPGYEMSGGGLIRNRRTREYLIITVMAEEPVTVNLDDITGYEHTVLLGTLINDTFPELKE